MSNKAASLDDEFVVGYIDVLGSTEAIKKDSKASFNMVNTAYKESLKIFETFFDSKRIKPQVKIFSDNIIIAVRVYEKENKRFPFYAVVMMCAIVQVEFLKKGWLTRGGVASGDFLADDTMVWGNALINAYELENKSAVYPRVIIDPKLIGELNVVMDKKINNWLRQDEDGLFYVNFLNNSLKNVDVFALSLFQLIEERIIQNNEKTNICQKWIWLSSYIKGRLPELGNENAEL